MSSQPELHVDASIYAKPFPRFERPKVIGYIGLENIKFARLVQDSKVLYNLNLHLEKAKRKPLGLDVKLKDLLIFLLEHQVRLNFPIENHLEKAKFFCYRGLMTCVACTPYENREPWIIVAILYKGHIYLCARDTEEKKRRLSSMTEAEKRFTSWGYKFEQYMLSDEPTSEPNPNEPVDETEEFSLVFSTHLKQHTIVYGAEMDGIRCDKTPNMSKPPAPEFGQEAIVDYLSDKQFIELKTNRHLEFSKQEKSFNNPFYYYKWVLSDVEGIKRIRKTEGILLMCGNILVVNKLSACTFSIHSFDSKNGEISQKFWDPNVCFNFLETFLTYVKRCLEREIKRKHGDRSVNDLQSLPLISLLFEWSPGMPVRVTNNYLHEDDPILPHWFTDKYGKVNR